MKNSLNFVSTCLRVVDTRRVGNGMICRDAQSLDTVETREYEETVPDKNALRLQTLR